MVALSTKVTAAASYLHPEFRWGELTRMAQTLGVSRTAIYTWADRVRLAFQPGGPSSRVELLQSQCEELNKRVETLLEQNRTLQTRLQELSRIPVERFRRFVVQAAISPVSNRNLVPLVKEAFGEQALGATFGGIPSHETLRQIVISASGKARQVFEQLNLPGCYRGQNLVSDEIFLGDTPLLAVADPHAMAILALSVGPDRSAESWEKLLAPFHGIRSVAKDLGAGMAAATQKRRWAEQNDIAHGGHELAKAIRKAESLAYAQIDAEYKMGVALKSRYGPQVPIQAHLDFLDLRQKTDRTLERFDQMEQIARTMRQTVEMVDPLGRFRSASEREVILRESVAKLRELGLPQWRKVESYWASPNIVTFVRLVEEDLQGVAVEAAPQWRARVLNAAIAHWALSRPLADPKLAQARFRRAVLLERFARSVCSNYEEVCHKVASIFDSAVRASSAIETINSIWRVYQQVKKTFGTDFAYLVALAHNASPFTEGPRKGKSPFALLGVDIGSRDWLTLVV